MNVKELIEQLKQFPDEMLVCIENQTRIGPVVDAFDLNLVTREKGQIYGWGIKEYVSLS